MKKIFLFIAVLFSLISSAQYGSTPPGYTSISARYDWLGGRFYALTLPVFNGSPSLRTGQWRGSGAVAYDTTNKKFKIWNGLYFQQYPDSVYSINDSAIVIRYGTQKDTVVVPGAGGGKTLRIGTAGKTFNIATGTADTINIPTADETHRGLIDSLAYLAFKSRNGFKSYTNTAFEYSPFLNTGIWRLKSSTVYPQGWYDAAWLISRNGKLYHGNGWRDYGAGAPATTDTVMVSSDNGATWAFHGLMPFKGHSIVVIEYPDGGILFAGNDVYGTATQRKSVWYVPPGGDIVADITLQTNNWGLDDRVLAYGFADANGNAYAGGGQTDGADSSTAVSYMWISTNRGQSWTKIQDNVTLESFKFLGGNTNGRVLFIDGFVHVLGTSRQDATAGERVPTVRCYMISIDSIADKTKWRRIGDMPFANNYPGFAVNNGLVWATRGSNLAGDNTKVIYYRDRALTWHPYNNWVGMDPADLSMTVTHASPMTSHNGQLVMGAGNGTNTFYLLEKTSVIHAEKPINIVGDLYINRGGVGYSNFYVNADSTQVEGAYYGHLTASAFAPTKKLKVTSDNSVVMFIGPKSVSNGSSLISFNDAWFHGIGHASAGSGFANGIGYIRASSNFAPFWINADNKFILNNQTTSIPTVHARSPGVIKGTVDTIMASTTLKPVVMDGDGNIFRAIDSTSSSSSNLFYGRYTDLTPSRRQLFDTIFKRVWVLGDDGFARGQAIYDSADVFDADARAYLNAILAASGSYNSINADSINSFVKALKANSMWTDIGYLYLWFGGNAGSHVINVRNPGTFNASLTGSWTHTAAGSKASTGGYANTGFSIASVVGNNNVTLSFLTNENSAAGNYDAGVFNASGAKEISLQSYPSTGTTTGRVGISGTQVVNNPGTGLGLHTVSRVSSTNLKLFNGATEVNSNTTSDSQVPTGNMFLSTGNIDGTPNFESLKRHQMDALWKRGLTPAEVVIWNTLINNLKTGLGR